MDAELEILTLLRENNVMLKEVLQILQKTQDPNYKSDENMTDFVMNVVANLVASNIERKRR